MKSYRENRRLTPLFFSPFSQRYGCAAAVTVAYGVEGWRELIGLFNALPIAGIVKGRAFFCQGGLSPGLRSPKDLDKEDRFGAPRVGP